VMGRQGRLLRGMGLLVSTRDQKLRVEKRC